MAPSWSDLFKVLDGCPSQEVKSRFWCMDVVESGEHTLGFTFVYTFVVYYKLYTLHSSKGAAKQIPRKLTSATFKTLISMTFYYTDWFIGILIMTYHNPFIAG